MFLKEVMRLYPPVYSIARNTTNPIHFPRGFGKDQTCSDETPVISLFYANSVCFFVKMMRFTASYTSLMIITVLQGGLAVLID